METQIPELKCKCLRCGHEWNRRTEKLPRMCTKCKSYYWNSEKRIIERPQLHCNKCGYNWKQLKDTLPVRCGRCATIYWNDEWVEEVIEEVVE